MTTFTGSPVVIAPFVTVSAGVGSNPAAITDVLIMLPDTDSGVLSLSESSASIRATWESPTLQIEGSASYEEWQSYLRTVTYSDAYVGWQPRSFDTSITWVLMNNSPREWSRVYPETDGVMGVFTSTLSYRHPGVEPSDYNAIRVTHVSTNVYSGSATPVFTNVVTNVEQKDAPIMKFDRVVVSMVDVSSAPVNVQLSLSLPGVVAEFNTVLIVDVPNGSNDATLLRDILSAVTYTDPSPGFFPKTATLSTTVYIRAVSNQQRTYHAVRGTPPDTEFYQMLSRSFEYKLVTPPMATDYRYWCVTSTEDPTSYTFGGDAVFPFNTEINDYWLSGVPSPSGYQNYPVIALQRVDVVLPSGSVGVLSLPERNDWTCVTLPGQNGVSITGPRSATQAQWQDVLSSVRYQHAVNTSVVDETFLWTVSWLTYTDDVNWERTHPGSGGLLGTGTTLLRYRFVAPPLQDWERRVPTLMSDGDTQYRIGTPAIRITPVTYTVPPLPSHYPVMEVAAAFVEITLGDGTPMLSATPTNGVIATYDATTRRLMFTGSTDIDTYVAAMNTTLFSDGGVEQTYTCRWVLCRANATLPSVSDALTSGTTHSFDSGLNAIGIVPRGSTNVRLWLDSLSTRDDDFQVFTKDGTHVIGTDLSDYVWQQQSVTAANIKSRLFTLANGFNPGSEYQNQLPTQVRYSGTNPPTNQHEYHGTTFLYSGDADRTHASDSNNDGANPQSSIERVQILLAAEDLIVFVIGRGDMRISLNYGSVPNAVSYNEISSCSAFVRTVLTRTPMIEFVGNPQYPLTSDPIPLMAVLRKGDVYQDELSVDSGYIDFPLETDSVTVGGSVTTPTTKGTFHTSVRKQWFYGDGLEAILAAFNAATFATVGTTRNIPVRWAVCRRVGSFENWPPYLASSTNEPYRPGGAFIHLFPSMYPGTVPIVGTVPKGARGLRIRTGVPYLSTDRSVTGDRDIQVFTKEGHHIVGTPLSDVVWSNNHTVYGGSVTPANVNRCFITGVNGFAVGARYLDKLPIIDYQQPIHVPGTADPADATTLTFEHRSDNGVMNITYSGDPDQMSRMDPTMNLSALEQIDIDVVTEDLFIAYPSVGDQWSTNGKYGVWVTYEYPVVLPDRVRIDVCSCNSTIHVVEALPEPTTEPTSRSSLASSFAQLCEEQVLSVVATSGPSYVGWTSLVSCDVPDVPTQVYPEGHSKIISVNVREYQVSPYNRTGGVLQFMPSYDTSMQVVPSGTSNNLRIDTYRAGGVLAKLSPSVWRGVLKSIRYRATRSTDIEYPYVTRVEFTFTVNVPGQGTPYTYVKKSVFLRVIL